MTKYLTYTLLLLLFSFPVNGEIYKWVDQHGNTHFTDKPPADKKAEEVKLKINTYTAVQITPLVERLGRKDKVVIYTTERCGYCKKAKQYFRDNNIAYIDYDVEKSRTGKRDYKLLKGKAVPIIIVGDKRMNGFSVPRFAKLYKKQMQKKAGDKNKEEIL
ncbi:hypothetical protein MNBD_GAMMA06-366 [hydrothermal vent metagenome]|uniref:Uncharacterized protein n=1 Tax=hydrothermal vent metagenome TaxID=652676 RepID=A0A3B0WQW6_9ZZZZ